MKRIGFIGYGLRSETMLKAFRALEADICVAAVADPRHAQIAPGTKDDPYFAETRWYEDAAPLLARDDLDGVFIGTRCPLHTPLACRVLKTGMPLFLEKPVCISREQYEALREAGRGQEKRVVVSFPLRFSTITLEMEKLARSGSLGRLTMVQAVNNVPYGSVYYHSWYRDPAQTGGLFLQKATHDVDYLCFLTGERPVSVCAATAKLYYRGDRPAGLRCPDCPDYRTCRESSYVVGRILKEDVQGDDCCFAKDTGNEDGAALILTFLLSKPLRAYQLGEVYAQNLGVPLRAFRAALILLSSVLSACVTAFAGPISFVGIAVPHLMKSLFKSAEPLLMIPACFLGGGAFCLFCDLIARTAFAPTEVSISSVTAVFGAPVVIYMMLHRKGAQ